MDLDNLTDGINPFNIGDWHGRCISLDGACAALFDKADVAKVVAEGVSGEGGWDGNVAAVLLLKDGRYVSYETFWGPTGSGFSEDAYGGDADLSFANDLETVVRMGLTDAGRELCKVELEPLQPTHVIVASLVDLLDDFQVEDIG